MQARTFTAYTLAFPIEVRQRIGHMDKDTLKKYAEQFGIKVDKRKSHDNIIESLSRNMQVREQVGMINAFYRGMTDAGIDVAMFLAPGSLFTNDRMMMRSPAAIDEMFRTWIAPVAYAAYQVTCDIEYKIWANNKETRIMPDVVVPSMAPVPTKPEARHALADALSIEPSEEKYLANHIAIRQNPNALKIMRITPKRTINIFARGNLWRDRRHFGSVLSYLTTTESFERPVENIAEAIATRGTCAFDIIREDLDLDVAQVTQLTGKQHHEGLTAADLVKVYSSCKRALYCFDLLDNIIDSHVFSNAERERNLQHGFDKRVFVLILANQHVYRPTDDQRAKLLKKTPDKAYHEEREVDKPESKQEWTVIHANDFNQALQQAESIVADKRVASPSAILERYKAEALSIDVAILAKKESFANMKAVHQGGRKISGIKAQIAPLLEAKEAAHTRALAEVKQARTNKLMATPTYIYVPQFAGQSSGSIADIINQAIADGQSANAHTAFATEYHRLIQRGRVYASDIGRTGEVTEIHIGPDVVLYANDDYANLSRTAAELGIRYKNQGYPAIARSAFNIFCAGDESKWRSSVFSNAVADILAFANAGALNMVLENKLADGERINGVDFRRQYSSIAHMGEFYTVPLTSDVEPYDGHAIGADGSHYIYYVETDDVMLFAGNGVYDFQVVQCGLTYGVIDMHNVVGQIRVAMCPTIDRTLRAFIDHVYAKVSDDGCRKNIINMLIGGFESVRSTTGSRTVITDNREEASYYWHTLNRSKRMITKLPQPWTGKQPIDVYAVSGYDIPIKRKSDALIRRAIVQRGRMQVFQLMRKIDAWPESKVIAVRTDAVYYKQPKTSVPYPIPEYKDDCPFGRIRSEPVGDLTAIKWQLHMPKPHEEKYTIKTSWVEPEIVSADEAFDASRLLKYTRAYVEGHAGAGKSTIIQRLKEMHEASGKKVITCSFTHAAARLVQGSTIHKVAGIDIKGNANEKSIKRLMSEVDVVLIDEMSMVPEVIYGILSQLPMSTVIIGFGDFRQLSPVEPSTCVGKKLHQVRASDERLYRDTSMFKSLFGYNLITLRKQWRSDGGDVDRCVRFHDVASACGVKAAMGPDMLPSAIKLIVGQDDLPLRNVCYTNKKRRAINNALQERECKNRSPYEERIMHAYAREPNRRYTYERYDAGKLAWICTNADKCAHLFSSKRNVSKEDLIGITKRYLVNSSFEGMQGKRQVEYCQLANGRWQPVGACGLSMLPRKIRGTIAHERYVDIDTVNCGFSILYHMLKEYGYTPVPMMRYLGEGREKTIEWLCKRLRCAREDAKSLIIELMNGGTHKYTEMKAFNLPWVRELKEMFERGYQMIGSKHPDELAEFSRAREAAGKNEFTNLAAFVQTKVLQRESQMLDVIIDTLRAKKLLGKDGDDYVMCFDGLMIAKSPAICDPLMVELSKAVKAKLGMEMQFKVKPMELDALDGYVPQPIKPVQWWLKYLDDRLWDEFTHVDVGMPVIANTTNLNKCYANGQRFTITKLDAAARTVRMADALDGQIIEVEVQRLRSNFRPAYCVTVHKSQGATIRERYAIHEFCALGHHGAYVALTRCTSFGNVEIRLDKPIQEAAVGNVSQDDEDNFTIDDLAKCLLKTAEMMQKEGRAYEVMDE
jgi:hypothetical protein